MINYLLISIAAVPLTCGAIRYDEYCTIHFMSHHAISRFTIPNLNTFLNKSVLNRLNNTITNTIQFLSHHEISRFTIKREILLPTL